MGNNMKKQRCGYSLIALAMLAMTGHAAATDLNVNLLPIFAKPPAI